MKTGQEFLLDFRQGLLSQQNRKAFGETASGASNAWTDTLLKGNAKWGIFCQKQNDYAATETQRLNAVMAELPAPVVAIALDQLLSPTLRQNDTVSFTKHALGLWFTMSRVKELLRTNAENVNIGDGRTHVPNPENFEFEAYIGAKDSWTPVFRPIKIDDTFTIYRDGKPFIYKAKYHPARKFGAIEDVRPDVKTSDRNAFHDHNLLLKYQAAIERNMIAGAVMEIRGRVDLKFLEWACGTGVFEPGAVPDVQIIYNLQLPSGADYRFTLKKSADRKKELAVTNDTSAYTALDKDVIRGVELALSNPSKIELYQIVSGEYNVSREQKLSQSFRDVASPDHIKDKTQFEEYMRNLREGIWNRLRAIKPENYNLNDDTIFTPKNTGLESDRERLGELVDSFQNYLFRNPDIARPKANYILGPEGSAEYKANRERLLDIFSKNLSLILARENERRSSPDYEQNVLYRTAMGWQGPEEGVGLSVDHVMFDSIAETMMGSDTAKKGRSYENANERFMGIDAVMAHLEQEKDRVVVHITYYDPRALEINPNKKKISTEYKNETEHKLTRLKRDQTRENIKRASEYLDRHYPERGGQRRKRSPEGRRYEEKHAVVAQMREALSEAKATAQAMQVKVAKIRKAHNVGRIAEDDESLRKMPDLFAAITEQRASISHVQHCEDVLWENLKPIFDETMQRKTFVQVFAHRENVMKFIYAIGADNKAVYDEESRGNVSGLRASHSELIGGCFGYGAGEIAFTFDRHLNRWDLTEINNGSGHYRPPAQSLEFASNIILGELSDHFMRQGLSAAETEVSVRTLAEKCRLTDAIARGIALRDAEVLTFHDAPDAKAGADNQRAAIAPKV